MNAESNNPSDTPHVVVVLLQQEHDTYAQLTALFEAERQHLIKREFDALAQVLAVKQTLLQQLEQFTVKRTERLTSLGYSVDREGLENYLMTLDDNSAELARECWQRLNELVLECQRLNEINARIAHRGHVNNLHVLDIMRGEPNKPKLYGPTGATKTSASTDSITSA
jgi:flagella synthesis protein FlgN